MYYNPFEGILLFFTNYIFTRENLINIKLPQDREHAIEVLIEKHKYFIISIVNKYCDLESYRDDLTQVANIALMEAFDTFDRKRNIKFETYLYDKVRWAVQKERNNFYLTSCSPNWRKHRPEEYDNVEENNIDPSLSPIEQIEIKEEWDEEYAYLRHIQKKLSRKLSLLERDVFMLYFLKSKKVSEVVTKVGICHSSVYKAIHRISIKINEILICDGKKPIGQKV